MLEAVTGEVGNFAFYHPPWFAVALVPLGVLPYLVARGVWLLLNVAAWVAGLMALTRAMAWPARGWGRWLLFLVATYLFAWLTWRYEQVGVLLFLLLATALWAIRAERWAVAGAMLALMLTKPTISAVMVGALLLWLVRARRWRVIQGFALTLLILGVVSAPLLLTYLQHLMEPGFTQGLTQEVVGGGSVGAVRINTTLRDWLASFGVEGSTSTVLYGVSIVLGLAAVMSTIWRGASAPTVASVAAVAAFWVAPYALQYDFPPLTVPLFVIMKGLAARLSKKGWEAVFLAGSTLLAGVLSVPLWEELISDGFWMVVGLTAALAIALPQRNATASFPG